MQHAHLALNHREQHAKDAASASKQKLPNGRLNGVIFRRNFTTFGMFGETINRRLETTEPSICSRRSHLRCPPVIFTKVGFCVRCHNDAVSHGSTDSVLYRRLYSRGPRRMSAMASLSGCMQPA